MQHDIVHLIDALEFARQNFSSSTDSSSRTKFVREHHVDCFGEEYRLDKADFDIVTICAVVRKTKIEITVIGLGDNVEFQKKEIDRIMNNEPAI